ncbi:MAG: RCC1 domain-containing protein [Acidobacteriota bacterium]
MKRLCLCLLAACTSPQYQPVELPWPVHVMAAGGDHLLVLTEAQGTTLDAGTVESDGPAIALPEDPNTQEPIALDLPTATDVAVGYAHACVVAETQVQCWGDNSHGALGAHRACNTTGCVLGPDVMPTLPPVRAVAAGDDFTCATTLDDTVMCWGVDTHGELGGSLVTALDPPLPVKTPDAKPLFVGRVVAADSTACAIDRDKAAWCWGEGYGATPVRLPYSGVVDVAVNADHGCVIASDGLTCWGDNLNGQIDATAARACTTSDCSLPPTSIALPGAARVVVGARHTCALAGGDVTCWGSNEHGQLARSDAFLVGDPAVAYSGVVDLVSASTHVCVQLADHSAYCWGDP